MAGEVKTDIAQKLTLPSLDPSLPIPLYYQLYAKLNEQIRKGKLPHGYMLPSEQVFVEKLGVSRITVKRAIDELAAVGMVTRKRGRGTQVNLNTALSIRGGVNEMVSTVTEMRLSTNAKLVTRDFVTPPENVMNNLKVTQGTRVEKIVHTIGLSTDPISISRTYAPEDITAPFSDADVERTSFMTLLEDSGTLIERADQIISAVSADANEAKILGIQEGDPLLEIQCLMTDRKERSLLYVITRFQPKFYRYEMTLLRK